MHELEKMKMPKATPISKNTWYEWCGWLISHILKSIKKLKSNAKQKFMRLFYSKIDNDTPTEYKPKKIVDIP